jgi:putative transposase
MGEPGRHGPEGPAEQVRAARAQAIGVFRFQLISAAIDERLSMRARGALVRQIAEAWHRDPFGNRVRFSRDTLDRWGRLWRQGGLEALVPSPRFSPVRTDADVLGVAAALKRENPARTAAQVERILTRSQGWSPSQSTLLRLFHRLDLPGADGRVATTGEVFGRFEAGEPNELWTGDALHGPRIGGRKTYLFAFIDDHSRLIAGHRWGFAEDTVRLAAALRPALAARGVPRACYTDNGSAFVDAWLLRGCAKLGIRLTHSAPGRPQGRGKIERFFGTVNEQFLVEVADSSAEDLTDHGTSQAAALLELNRLFTAWVETVYHTRVHSETEQTPPHRWEAGWQRCGARPRMPAPADLAEAFRWSEFRTVQRKTATVSLYSNTYQVDAALIGRRVELVFDPFDMGDISVRYHGKAFGQALAHTISRHSHPKARPETPQKPPPAATGIDYLNLIAADHHAATGAAINFHALTGPRPHDEPGPDDGAATRTDPDPHPGPGGGPHSQPGQVPGQLPLPGMSASTDHAASSPEGARS